MSNVTRKGFLATTAGMGIALGLAACGGNNKGGNAGSAGGSKKDPVGASAELIDAAKKEGSLVVYVSCEEDYGAAVCNHF